MTYNYSNTSVATTLNGAVDAVTTEIVVDSTSGFPVSFPYSLIIDPDSASKEVVTVSAAAGTTLTVARGEDGTVAGAHDDGASVIHGAVARDFQESQDHIDATTSVHGVAGSVVGTTSTQTLTNKTLDGGANTFTNIPTSAIADSYQSYTPTFTTGITVGNGTLSGSYRQVGDHVDWNFELIFGSTTTLSSPGLVVLFTLPVTPISGTIPLGWGLLIDDSANVGYQAVAVDAGGGFDGLIMHFQADGTYFGLDATVPFTWAEGDRIALRGSYEAA